MSGIWDAITDAFESGLEALHSVLEPVFGAHAWGWAIIALTIVVRVLLLPLAIKQTRSMRAMQAMQPKVKALQKKYKADRDLMRKDPDLYRKRKQKLNEETMALYKAEGVNPASGCLPLLAQAPVFIALFWVLRSSEDLPGAPFYFFTDFVAEGAEASGLAVGAGDAGWPGWLLILIMAATMFFTQRQMMSRSIVDDQQRQQQRILMIVMPVFLAVISFQFPLGVLLYWVTTNFWQIGQQAVILREVAHSADAPAAAGSASGQGGKAGGRRATGQGGKASGADGAPDEAATSKRPRGKAGKDPSPAAGAGHKRADRSAKPERRAPSPGSPAPRSKPPATPASSREQRRSHLPSRPHKREDPR